MTQSPYTPPNSPHPMNYSGYSTAPGADPYGPAKRAGIMTYIVGGIMIAMSVCCIGMSSVLPRMLQEQPQMAADMSRIPGFTPELAQKLLIGLGILGAVVGLTLIVLGRFVRASHMGAIATAIVLSALVVLYLVVNMVSPFLMGSANVRGAAMGICVLTVPLALFATQLAFLIQAARASGQVRAMQQQYAMQYWQYQQQQQAYNQAYAAQGYAAPPQPPQSSAPPPQPYPSPAAPPPSPSQSGGPDGPTPQG